MLLIEWNEEMMSCGIDEIDQQHKKLLNLINNITDSIQKGNQAKDIEKFIALAMEYSEYHFSKEEEFFYKLNLTKDDIQEHKKEHKEFINMVSEINLKLKKDESIKNSCGIEMLTEFNCFLSDWLINHIVCKDKSLLSKKWKKVK